jgi:hypothetical protein
MGRTLDSQGRLIYRVKINGRTWRVSLSPPRSMGTDWGRCWDKDKPGRHPLIEVRRSLGERNLLETVIHEVLHAARPELDEPAVDATALSIARALYQMGWRRKLD